MVEVAGRSLADDQGKKLAGYARAGIPVYWIINLGAGQVEVYTRPDPTASQYGNHVDYRPGQACPVIIDGQVVGHIAVADLLPKPRLATGWQENFGRTLTMTKSDITISIAVAIEPVFKYQGLRSLPWGVRMSLLRRIPVSGAPTFLGRPLRHFLRRSRPTLQRLLIDATIRASSPTNNSSSVPRSSWCKAVQLTRNNNQIGRRRPNDRAGILRPDRPDLATTCERWLLQGRSDFLAAKTRMDGTVLESGWPVPRGEVE